MEEREKKKERMFIQSARDARAQFTDKNHGPTCACDDCFIFLHEGARQVKVKSPGSFFIDLWQDKKMEDILPS